MRTPLSPKKQETGVASCGPSIPPLSFDVLRDFAHERQTTIDALNKRLEDYAQKLRGLIPPELKQFAAESFLANPTYLVKLIAGIARVEGDSGYACLSEKFKEPRDYGFKDTDDVVRGMKLLKKAWQGLLDVKIDTSCGYAKVTVSPAGMNPNRSAYNTALNKIRS